MDPKKTGAFIAQLRKEKQYTQKELAQRLNVSDKAISRWETGKGFPDTALLKPLSDELGVSVGELLSGQRIPKETLVQKTEQVLVTSMETSGKRLTAVYALCAVLAVILICCGILAAAMLIPPSPLEFVNESTTTMYYRLGDTAGGTVYTNFASAEFDGGMEYWLADGTRRYLFTTIPEISSEPVLSYAHVSGEGVLFGFAIGQNTIIKSNADLGVAYKSLRTYLEENGFQYQYIDDEIFGRPHLIYIDGERCNWYPYVKDNVLVNICISAREGNRLMGFDIGLVHENMNAYYESMKNGFSLTVEDPYGLVTGEIAPSYRQWDAVTLTAKLPPSGQTLYCYINDRPVGKFSPALPPDSNLCRITFGMWGAPITVRVTTEWKE